MSDSVSANGDSEDLEALFDSIVSANSEAGAPAKEEPVAAPPVVAPAEPGGEASGDKIYAQIGQMTRQLHNTLRELGYDKKLEEVVSTIPDARDRLGYIAAMTEQAAERALNATETARPIQESLEANAADLSKDWQRLFDKQLNLDEFKDLVTRTRSFLDNVPAQTRATNEQLMEIMMAQDFQDLTGQVIKKTIDMAQQLEQQMLQLLLTTTPPDKRPEVDKSLLNGPVVKAGGRTDVVTSQAQVDELLESLGF